ncbi:LytR/AlgR family response regulator transcription factor [Brevibacterium album]|uniref:LytR/AlgR family response regulator transcription factor n=1 Tax=Brevibacterium album TaxID=417948 RepID=UPI000427DEBB|nr:response regulator [Brevibacterium album]
MNRTAQALPRALIVDDEAPAREELRHLLQELGSGASDTGGAPLVQVVGEATNGEEALVLLTSLDYDLVFLDIRMPGLTGLEVARRLGELPRRPQIVFTTAYSEHAVDAFDLAAADYLVKPFDPERLRRAVERALGTGADSRAGASDPRGGAADLRTAAGFAAETGFAAEVGPAAAVGGSGTGSAGTGSAGAEGALEAEGASGAVGTAGARTPAGTAGGLGPGGAGQEEPSGHSRARAADEGTAGFVRIPVQRGGRTVLVDGDDIVYVAAARGYSALKLVDDQVLVSYSLSELERRLQGHFFRAHRSYLVNLRCVRELVSGFRGGLVLVMNDRERSRVEVSRRHSRELRRRLGLAS